MLTERWSGVQLRPSPPPSLRRGRDQGADGLLLVAHGSSCVAGSSEMRLLGAAVAAARSDLAVELGFLELADPPAGVAMDMLIARGCRRIVVQPMILLAAGHGKSDVPAVALEGRERHPDVEIICASPLGVVPELLAVAAANLDAAGAMGLPLLVVARGTSDPDANADAVKAARLLAEWIGVRSVDVAYTGVTWPTVPEVLQRLRALGNRRVALFFWFLANGRLVERAREQVAGSGLDVVDAGYFGPDPRLIPVLEQRRQEALGGVPRVNCDTCSYRSPWPGMESRLSEPIGVGHSQLALEHRHTHR